MWYLLSGKAAKYVYVQECYPKELKQLTKRRDLEVKKNLSLWKRFQSEEDKNLVFLGRRVDLLLKSFFKIKFLLLEIIHPKP